VASEAENKINESIEILESAESECRAVYYGAIDRDEMEEALAIQKEMTRSVRQIKNWKAQFELLLEEMRMNPIL
jgi:hypothetical protein